MNDTPSPLSPTPLAYWVYISEAAQPFRDDELPDLLRKSRENNARLGLTGLLLYKDGNFIQMLEGPESVVQSMTEKIGRDARHRSLVSLAHANQTQRLFPETWMDYVASDALSDHQRAQIDSLLRMSRVAPGDIDATTGAHPARTLMETFARYM